MSDIEEATAVNKAIVEETLVKTEPTGTVAINFASEEQLTTIPGTKAKLARALVASRENSGNIKKFSDKLLSKIDFTKNKNLPAVATSEEDSEASASSESDTDAEPQSEPSSTDWAEVAKVIRAAKQVIESQQTVKQEEKKGTACLFSDKAEKKSDKKSGKPLILKPPADFMTPKKASPDLTTATTPVVSKKKLVHKTSF